MSAPVASSPSRSGADEQVLAVISRHELGLLGTAIRVVTISAGLGIVWAFIARFVPAKSGVADLVGWTFLAVCGCFALWIMLGRFRAWASAQLTVTNHRVRIRYRRRRQGWEIPIATILDVRTQVGPLQRLFGVGTLIIQTNFAPGPAMMFDVGKIRLTQAQILALRDECWARYPWSAPVVGHDWTVRAAS